MLVHQAMFNSQLFSLVLSSNFHTRSFVSVC